MDASKGIFGFRHGIFLFSPDSLGLHIDGEPEEYPFHGEANWTRGDSPRTAIYMHEEDHLLRSIGTSAGLMAHTMNGRVLDSYLRVLVQCDLRKFLADDSFSTAIARARKLPEINQEPFSALFLLGQDRDVARALWGERSWSSPTIVQRSAARHWGALLTIEEELDDLVFRPPNPRYPSQGLDACSVIETLGILKESIYRQEGGDLVQADVTYHFALAYARAELSELFDWEVQPVEVEAALSLALWSPLTPYGLWPGRSYRWSDIEPGHRFRAIIERVRDRGRPLTNHLSLNDLGRDDFFRSFFEETCRELGWATPDLLADAWLTHLSAARAWQRTDAAWWNLGQSEFRTKRAIQFLKDFRSRPFNSFYQDEASRLQADRIRFSYLAYSLQINVQEADVDQDNTGLSVRFDGDVFLGMYLILDGTVRSPTTKTFVEQHLGRLPMFVPNLDDRRQFDENLEFLRERFLTEE